MGRSFDSGKFMLSAPENDGRGGRGGEDKKGKVPGTNKDDRADSESPTIHVHPEQLKAGFRAEERRKKEETPVQARPTPRDAVAPSPGIKEKLQKGLAALEAQRAEKRRGEPNKTGEDLKTKMKDGLDELRARQAEKRGARKHNPDEVFIGRVEDLMAEKEALEPDDEAHEPTNEEQGENKNPEAEIEEVIIKARKGLPTEVRTIADLDAVVEELNKSLCKLNPTYIRNRVRLESSRMIVRKMDVNPITIGEIKVGKDYFAIVIKKFDPSETSGDPTFYIASISEKEAIVPTTVIGEERPPVKKGFLGGLIDKIRGK